MQPATYARVAATTFAAQTVFAVVHLATGGTYPGYTHGYSVFSDVLVAIVWGASAVAGLTQRPWQGHFVMLTGMLLSFWHGVMVSVALSDRGPYGVAIPLLLAGGIQAYCIWHQPPAFFEPRPERAAVPHRPLLERLHLRHTH
jgi:hypothetical protein